MRAKKKKSNRRRKIGIITSSSYKTKLESARKNKRKGKLLNSASKKTVKKKRLKHQTTSIGTGGALSRGSAKEKQKIKEIISTGRRFLLRTMTTQVTLAYSAMKCFFTEQVMKYGYNLQSAKSVHTRSASDTRITMFSFVIFVTGLLTQ